MKPSFFVKCVLVLRPNKLVRSKQSSVDQLLSRVVHLAGQVVHFGAILLVPTSQKNALSSNELSGHQTELDKPEYPVDSFRFI